MKLNTATAERTQSQFDAQAIPENHPVVHQLNSLFGDHTFFLDAQGLNIVEPAGNSATTASRPRRWSSSPAGATASAPRSPRTSRKCAKSWSCSSRGPTTRPDAQATRTGRPSSIERMSASKAPATSSMSATGTGNGLPVSIVSAKASIRRPSKSTCG